MLGSRTRGARVPYERDSSIPDLFDAAASAAPDATAVRDDAGSLSYSEVAARSDLLANRLTAIGVAPGARVGIALDRSIEVAVVLLAILKAGAAYVPLDPSLPAERTAFVIADLAIETIVVAKREDAARYGVANVIALDEDADATAARGARRPDVRPGPNDIAYVMYTSGSTGRPKGVEIPHRAVVRLVRGADYVEIRASDVFFQFAPLAFDASTFEIWGALLNGATLAIAPGGTNALADVGAALERFGVTILWLTAPLFSLMVRTELGRFGGLRYLLAGGDVVSVDDAATFVETHAATRLVNGYGPTENTTFSCCYEIASRAAIGNSVPIGRPIANSTAYILDCDLAPVGAGEIGELFVGGDGVARGYANLPELTAERFVADPFGFEPGARMYRTGDLARTRADGAIEFLGRRDHQVKIRGYRIELGEIEHALRALPGIVEAAVVVSEERAAGKTLVALVVASDAGASESGTIRERLAATLPSYAIPHRIANVAALPKTSSGKLDRAALAALARRPEIAPVRRALRPGRTLEASIAACWVEVLGPGADADRDVNFFDAGGDSLRLLAMHDRLVRTLGMPIEVLDLFTHVTIRSLATALGDRKAS